MSQLSECTMLGLGAVIGVFIGVGWGINYKPANNPLELEVNYMSVDHDESNTTVVTLPDGSKQENTVHVHHIEKRSVPFERQTMAHLVGAE